jgi:hypothetical protein
MLALSSSYGSSLSFEDEENEILHDFVAAYEKAFDTYKGLARRDRRK